MKISFDTYGRTFSIDPDKPIDISIPLDFAGEQPNVYGVEKATSKACEAGELVGDTRRGGSVNFEQVKLIPHCNGTHTECVGHITHERISVNDCLKDAFCLAMLVSVQPESPMVTHETYPIKLQETDRLITRLALYESLSILAPAFFSDDAMLPKDGALIVRTLPNNPSKKAQSYTDKHVPPFFSTEAMQFIVEQGVRHLLVDVPSIDRIFDEGKLANHRLFWNVEPGSFEISEASRIHNTITELAFIPERAPGVGADEVIVHDYQLIEDGPYILNLQIPAFQSDAAPSRPVIFRLI